MESIKMTNGASKKALKIAGIDETSEVPYVYEIGGRKFIIPLKEDEIAFLEGRKNREVK